MLSSSDAKFRCLWHMFIWSITLTLVSQFYSLTDHVAFYVFGGLSIMVLPFVTSLYSTTSGRRGANLLRVAYVVCDPVIACTAVVPVLLLNKLSSLIHEMECLSIDMKSWNDTLNCLGNKSMSPIWQIAKEQKVDFSLVPGFWLERRNFLVAIEVSVVIPCVLALMMGRRSRKMYPMTPLITFSYWLITSIECVTLIETVLLCGSSRVDYAVTTEITACVACIVCNSYGMVTLCSYVSPLTCRGDKEAVAARFNNVYKYLVGCLGVVFVEIPQLAARIQLIASTSDWPSMYESSYLYQGTYNHESSIRYSHLSKHSDEVPVMNSTMKNHLDPNFTAPMRDNQLQHPVMLPQSIINITHRLEDKSLIYKLHLPASFYIWGFKDAAMIVVIIALLVFQKYGRSPPIFLQIFGKGRGCAGVAFDNPDATFIPEKRDKYIVGCSDYRDGAQKLDVARSSQSLLRADSQDDSCKKNDQNLNSNDRLRNKSNKLSLKNYSDDTTNTNLNRTILNMTIVSNSIHLKNPADRQVTATTSTTENCYNDNNGGNNKQSNDHQVTSLDNVTNDKVSGSGVLINVTDVSNEMSLDQTRDPALLRHRSSLDESGGERRIKKSVKFSLSEDKSVTSKTSNDNSNVTLLSALKYPPNLNNSSGSFLDPSNISNNNNNNINNNNNNYNNNNGNTNFIKSVNYGKLNANIHSNVAG